MRRRPKVACAFMALLGIGGASAPSLADGAAGWTSTGIGILSMGSGSDGNLIFIDTAFAEGCPEASTVRVDDAQPNLSRILALASLALASGLKVQFYLTGTCLGRGGEVTDIRVFAN